MRQVAFLCLLLLAGCARTPAPVETGRLAPEAQAAIDRLLDAMRQRLVIMHDVARWKWNAKASIHDPAREQTILDSIVARSKLDPGFTRAFFTAQFAAARQVQEDDFRRWEGAKQAAFADAPDLTGRLRPRIDTLSDELLGTLAAIMPLLDDPAAQRHLQQRAPVVLRGDGITDTIRETAVAPLLAPRRE